MIRSAREPNKIVTLYVTGGSSGTLNDPTFLFFTKSGAAEHVGLVLSAAETCSVQFITASRDLP